MMNFFGKKEKRSTAVNGIRDVGIETIGRTNNDSQAAGINYKSRQKRRAHSKENRWDGC